MPEKNGPSSVYYTRLIGEINYSTIREVMRDIDSANTQDCIKEIVFTIVSHGGDLASAFALYVHIKASRKPIDIITEGLCMSSAVMVLQAGRRRIARSYTVFMVHPSSIYLQEHDRPYNEFLSIVDQYKKNQELFIALTIRKSGMSRKEFEKIYAPRKYLTPTEAKNFGKYGLIDEVEEYR